MAGVRGVANEVTGPDPRRGFAAVALALLLATTTPAGARTDGAGPARAMQVEREVSSEAGDLASAPEARLLELIEEAEARRDQVESRAASVSREVQDLRSSLNAAEEHLGALQARQWTLEHRLAAADRQIEEARQRRRQIALDAYTGRSGGLGYAASLLHAQDLGSLATRRSYVHLLGSSQAENLATEERLRAEVGDLLEELDGVRREMRTKRTDAAADAVRVEHRQQVRASLIAQAEAEVDERDRLYEEARSRQDEFEAELADLAAQSERVTEILRARRGISAEPGDSDAAAAASGDELAHPLPGHRLGSGFGPRVHPIFGSVRMHTGVDIGAAAGAPIHSGEDGVVVRAGWMGGYGRATVVDHGSGLATLYGHQSQISVVEGERVSRGQVIGRVGCTGTCTGDHLHFEVRIDGRPVNPNPYVT